MSEEKKVSSKIITRQTNGDWASEGGNVYVKKQEKKEEMTQIQAPGVDANEMAQMLFNMNEVVDKKDRYDCQSIFKRYNATDDKGDRTTRYGTTDGLAISQKLMENKEETKKDIGDYFKEMDTITTSEAKKEFKTKLAQNIMFAIGAYYSSCLLSYNNGCCQPKAVRHHFRDEKSDTFMNRLEEASKCAKSGECYKFFEPTGRGGRLTASNDVKDEKGQPYDDVKLNDVYGVYNSAYTNLASSLLSSINNEDKSLKDEVSSMLEAAASAYNLTNSKDNKLNQTVSCGKNFLNYSGRTLACCIKMTPYCLCNCCCNCCGKGHCSQGFNNMRRGGSRLIGKGVNKIGFMRWAVKDYKSTKEKYSNVVNMPWSKIQNINANTCKNCKSPFCCIKK